MHFRPNSVHPQRLQQIKNFQSTFVPHEHLRHDCSHMGSRRQPSTEQHFHALLLLAHACCDLRKYPSFNAIDSELPHLFKWSLSRGAEYHPKSLANNIYMCVSPLRLRLFGYYCWGYREQPSTNLCGKQISIQPLPMYISKPSAWFVLNIEIAVKGIPRYPSR